MFLVLWCDLCVVRAATDCLVFLLLQWHGLCAPFHALSVSSHLTSITIIRPTSTFPLSFLPPQMAAYDERSGNLFVTELGRVASHFYIKWVTPST